MESYLEGIFYEHCGMNCNECLVRRAMEMPCSNCKKNCKNKVDYTKTCLIRLCALEHQIECSECKAFPCEKMEELDLLKR